MAKSGNSRNKTQPRATKTTRKTPGSESGGQPVVDTLSTHIAGQRRPFAGFDRERATYHRLKPDLLLRAEGRQADFG